MEELIIAGYIPFTDIQISFTFFAVGLSITVTAWFYWSLNKHLHLAKHSLPPTISSDITLK